MTDRDTRQRRPVTVPPVYKSVYEKRKEPCRHAQPFVAWVDDLMAYVSRDPSRSTLIIAQKQLQDKYFDLRAVVPADHRDLVTNRSHRCIWHVYRDAYEQLRTYEIRYVDSGLNDLEGEHPDFVPLGDVIDGDADDDLAETTAD